MLVFVNAYGSGAGRSKVILPLDRIYNIWEVRNKLVINYDSGDLVYVEGTYQKKIESVYVVYEDEKAVVNELRKFYKACINGSGAFYFGGQKDTYLIEGDTSEKTN